MDWVDPLSSEPDEEREDDMSSLSTGFATRMRKRDASTQREITFGSEGPNDKRPKRSGTNGEVQKIPIVITVDSSERALSAMPALEGPA